MSIPEHSDKQSLLDKLQPIVGVTKNELIFATSMLVLSLAALLVRYVQKPVDTFDTELRKQVQHLFDSVATADSLRLVASGDTTATMDTSNILQPFLYHPEHQEYKKKELPTSTININTASKEDLMKLPGVGEKMADKIIDYRKQERFKTPEDLMNVSGIGEKKFEKMKPYVKTQ
ncbi:MAG: helix-hairpin-helix domain-containing protein [Candidatus Kapabacteria bacterium]|nr:helix-hairpin-helix domain-containing protein [Candidatus Kapabacteria bacterium]